MHLIPILAHLPLANNEEEEEENIDSILEVQNPLPVKPKGRPARAPNKKRTAREAAFEDSTHREPSRFEHQETNRTEGTQSGGLLLCQKVEALP